MWYGFPHFSNMPLSPKSWTVPSVDFLPPQHCYIRITVFPQTFPLSENTTYFGHWKLLIRSSKPANFNCFALLRLLAVKAPYYPQHPFLSQRVDCASARLRLTLISNSAAVLTFQRSLLLIHKKRSQICIMYSIKFNWIQ